MGRLCRDDISARLCREALDIYTLRRMTDRTRKDDIVPEFIRQLMPGAGERDLLAARTAVRQYLEAVLRICDERQPECGQPDSLDSGSHSKIPTLPTEV